MADTEETNLKLIQSGGWFKIFVRSWISNKLSTEAMMRGSSNENEVM